MPFLSITLQLREGEG